MESLDEKFWFLVQGGRELLGEILAERGATVALHDKKRLRAGRMQRKFSRKVTVLV